MKNNIRNQMKLLRKNLNELDKKKLDKSIVDQIKKDKDFLQSKVVAFYIPMAQEINLLSLYDDHKTFLVPRMDDQQMVFIQYNPNMKLIPSTFGVLEPSKNEEVYDGKIDYMLIPALAIDLEMHRIGYGKAFYDQYILKQRPTKIVGVIYPFQEIKTFNHESHDQKLDGYIKGEL
jgi:5-formyltetrahydrofolate cyclo-ligase